MDDKKEYWKSKSYWEDGEKEYDVSDAHCGRIKHPKNKQVRSRLESVTKVKYASDVMIPRDSNWEYKAVNTKLNPKKELEMQVEKDWRRRVRERLGTTDGAMSYFKPLIQCPINGDWIVGDKEVYAQAQAEDRMVEEVRKTTEKNWDLRNHKPIKADPKVYEEIAKVEKSYGPSKKAGGKIYLTKAEIAERKRLEKMKDAKIATNKEEELKEIYKK